MATLRGKTGKEIVRWGDRYSAIPEAFCGGTVGFITVQLFVLVLNLHAQKARECLEKNKTITE